MGRFNVILMLVFAFGLMTSVSMEKSHSRAKAPFRAEAPVAAAPKPAATESPAASPPTATTSKDAKTPASALSLSHTAQPPASGPLAAGRGSASPPKSGAAATAKVEKIMAIFGAALIGGATFLLSLLLKVQI